MDPGAILRLRAKRLPKGTDWRGIRRAIQAECVSSALRLAVPRVAGSKPNLTFSGQNSEVSCGLQG